MQNNTVEKRERAKQSLPTISSIIKEYNYCVVAANELPPNDESVELFEQHTISKDDLTNFIWWLNVHDMDILDRHVNTASYDEFCDQLVTIVELKTGISFYVVMTDTDCVVSVYPTIVEN